MKKLLSFLITAFVWIEKGHFEQLDYVAGLTNQQIDLIQQSWGLIRTDLNGNGIHLFLMFFGKHPEYQKLFPFKNVPYNQLPNKLFQNHVNKVMNALTKVVDNLNHGQYLQDLLKIISKIHSNKSVPREAFQKLKTCIIDLLKGKLGQKFTQKNKEAWDKGLTWLITTITNNLSKN